MTESSQITGKKWSEFDLDDDGNDDIVGSFNFETPVDKDGIKTITNYVDGPDGTTKVTTRVKVISKKTRRNKAVYERRDITPFGLDDSSSNSAVLHHEEITIDVPKGRKKFGLSFDEQDQEENPQWSTVLPKTSMDLRQKFRALRGEDGGGNEEEMKGPKAGGRVVRLSHVAKDSLSRDSDQKRREENTIRVTNLSEDVKDDDLQELFGEIGVIDRIYLAKHKEKKCSKGFAFVTYHSREDALKAIRQLNRHGYDNLVLNVEWARPSNREGGR